MCVGAILQEGSDRLRGVTDTPQLEAELLLSEAMGHPRVSLLAHPEWTPTPEQRAVFHGWLDRRATGYPLPYLTSRANFYGLELKVTPDALIPRPETETLVDLALQLKPRVAVDVGTGSGAIALALAKHLPHVHIVATDLSAAALQVAAANVRRYGLENRIHLVQSDLVRPLALSADLVVSNPPYVAEEEWTTLPRSIQQHEPALALLGGAGGMTVIRRLLQSAGRILRSGGRLLMEIGAGQGSAAAKQARSLLPGTRVSVHADLAGRDRVLDIGF
ncbi:MAG: peptide chain release factor N(5)-glutamine methyltransferase [Anaerolineae bacterium]|jgi:release factor glutamine methyltransferase